MSTADLTLAMRLARRELRGGVRGFGVFFLCLFLGVMIVAAVGSANEAFLYGLSNETRMLLGGDAEVRLVHRPASTDERAWLDQQGQVSATAGMRAMAFNATTGERTLVEAKSVDAPYPLLGSIDVTPRIVLSEIFEKVDGHYGVAAEPLLLDRLNLSVGDKVRLGTTQFEVRAAIDKEPDRIGGGFRYGPRILMSEEALAVTGLVQPGSLIYYRYRLVFDGTGGANTNAFKEAASLAFPAAGWRIRSHSEAAGGVRENIQAASIFLTFVGFAALVIGGVGVSNAVGHFLEKKREVIAVFKCLGAEGSLVFAIYMLQVMSLALVAIALGILAGSLVPFGLVMFFGEQIPIPIKSSFYPVAVFQAAASGILVTLMFSMSPLLRARQTSAARLFRAQVSEEATARSWPALISVVICAALIAASALLTSAVPWVTLAFLCGVALVFLLLLYLGRGIAAFARRWIKVRTPVWRLALSNLHRPGAATGSVVLSLGLGLTLLVTIVTIEGAMLQDLDDQMPEETPAFFFIDIQKSQSDAFANLLKGLPGVSQLMRVPNLRGRVSSIKGVPAADVEVSPDAQWVLRGDRGLTYSVDVPDGSTVVKGEWWPSDYQGPPLVSLKDDLAAGLGLDVGDAMTINILGRDIDVIVGSLREFDWRSMGFNYVIVFDPYTLTQAPHSFVANVRASPDVEEDVYRAVSDAFPNVSVVRVREALDTINTLLANLSLGVRIASGITIIAGAVVLAGAIAAGRRARLYDSVVLKVLGATRGWTLRTFLYEFAVLGVVTAICAIGLGVLAAYLILTFIIEIPFSARPFDLAQIVLGSMMITVLFGMVGTWRLLGAKVSPVLRTE